MHIGLPYEDYDIKTLNIKTIIENIKYMQKIYDFKAFSSKGKEIGLKAKAAKTLFKAISKNVEII